MKKRKVFNEEIWKTQYAALLGGFVMEMANLKDQFQNKLNESKVKNFQYIEGIIKTHEDQNHMLKGEANNDIGFMTRTLKEQIETLKSQLKHSHDVE